MMTMPKWSWWPLHTASEAAQRCDVVTWTLLIMMITICDTKKETSARVDRFDTLALKCLKMLNTSGSKSKTMKNC